jgi:hypothetical protein
MDAPLFIDCGVKRINVNAITFILDPGKGQEMNIYFGPSGPEVALRLEIAEADQFRDWLKTKARSGVRAA